MALSPYGLLLLIILFVAFLAPLVPLRRRSAGIAHFPIVTVSLLAFNIIVYFASLSGATPSRDTIAQWGMVPHAVSVVTLISHMFLHGSWDHLFGNMLGLWLFGPHVEEALGRLEYLLFYIGCGVAAGLLHLAVTVALLPGAADTPLVGASGAIFGLLGLFAVRYWRAKVRVLLVFTVPAVWAVSAFALIQLIAGITAVAAGDLGRVANWAHVGGFLFGALLALPLKMREESHKEYGKEDAELAAAMGHNEVAAAHYRSVLTTAPNDAETHHALANVYISLRQSEAAHRHMMEALRLFLKNSQSVAVARVYEDALHSFESFPLPPYLLQRIATACEETEAYSLAVHALSELCREHPKALEAEVGLLRLGNLHLFKMNQPGNAESIFSEFLRMYPQSEYKSHALRLRDEARHASVPPGPIASRG